jgi:ribosomal protein L36
MKLLDGYIIMNALCRACRTVTRKSVFVYCDENSRLKVYFQYFHAKITYELHATYIAWPSHSLFE